MANAVTIDVVSDVVCPWCYLGMKRLQRALASLPDVEATVRWRPFQLDPTIPPQGLDRNAYMLGKFGDPSRIEAAHARLEQLGAEDGIDFDFDAIKVSPNTLDAHRVIRWATNSGLQGKVVADLFSRYFERGENIGSREVLGAAASDAGMDAAVIETLLATDAEMAEVKEEIETAGKMGITGVPCFIIAGQYAVMGAQPAEALVDAIAKAASGEAVA